MKDEDHARLAADLVARLAPLVPAALAVLRDCLDGGDDATRLAAGRIVLEGLHRGQVHLTRHHTPGERHGEQPKTR